MTENNIIDYDRGTIIFSWNLSDHLLMTFPQIIWDQRSMKFRAPANFYKSIIAYLLDGNINVIDNVLPKKILLESWKEISLRPYQEMAVNKWFLGKLKGIVVLPTGAGKTRVAIKCISLAAVSTLCVVPTRVLLNQWHMELSKYYNGPIGIIGDGNHIIHPITVATFESAYRYMWKLGNSFELLVIDEVHHFGKGIRDEIFDLSIATFSLGLTATLSENEENYNHLQNKIGRIIFKVNIDELRGKYLADFHLFPIHLALNSSETKSYQSHMKVFRDLVTFF